MIGNPNWLNRLRKKLTGGGGGGGGWAQIGSGVVAASSDSSNVAIPPTDFTGATAIFAVVAELGNNTMPTSSPSNTWVLQVGQVVSFAGEAVSIWACLAPTTSSSMTISVSANQPAIAVFAFSGGVGTKDKTSGAFALGPPQTTLQAGAITPTSNGQLIIAAAASTSGSIVSIDSGFNTPLIAARNLGVSMGIGASWLVQTIAASINPTWTSSATDMVAAISSHIA